MDFFRQIFGEMRTQLDAMRYEPVSIRKLLATDTVIMEMQWRIQYPRQGRGANPEGGGANYYLVKSSQKSENESNRTERGRPSLTTPAPPSANEMCCVNQQWSNPWPSNGQILRQSINQLSQSIKSWSGTAC